MWAQTDAPSQELVSLPFTSGQGFCFDGIIPQLLGKFGERGRLLTIWGTGCTQAPIDGHAESIPFLAPPTISMFLTGYVGLPGMRLALRNVASGQEIELRPSSIPTERWQHNDFSVPAGWVGQPAQIIAEHAAASGSWFGFTAPQLSYSQITTGMIQENRPQAGFCRGGVFPRTAWPGRHPPRRLAIWGSYCDAGDNNIGWMASEEFTAGAYLRLYLAGYPGTPGLRLSVQSLQTRQQLPLQISSPPQEVWQLYNFPLPHEWKGQPIRLLAEDEVARAAGWLAFAIVPTRFGDQASFALRLLLLTAFLFVMVTLPGIAICLLLASRGLSSLLDLTASAIVTIGIVGYLSFWAYFLNHTAGLVFSYLTALLCCAAIVYALRRRKKQGPAGPLGRLVWLWTVVGLASAFTISIGFLYGKPISMLNYSAQRFSPPKLSVDNFLPKLLADDLYSGHIPRPMTGDWLSSDRPPLQSGLALWNYAWTNGNRDLSYQVLGVIFQFTCLAGIFAYLEATRVSRTVTALVLAAAVFWGFAFLNSFFSWPKLLPTAFLFIVAAYLFTGRYTSARSDWRVGAMVGAAAALAMLCHGGSAFGILGIGLTALLLVRVPGSRFVAGAILAGALLYLPWSLYQKYYDPPGDRLLKWHLGGQISPRPEESLGHVLAENYGKLSRAQIVDYKRENFQALIGSEPFWHAPMLLLRGVVTGNYDQMAAAVVLLR